MHMLSGGSVFHSWRQIRERSPLQSTCIRLCGSWDDTSVSQAIEFATFTHGACIFERQESGMDPEANIRMSCDVMRLSLA